MVPGMLSVVRVSVRAVAKDRRARGRATNDLIRLLRPVVTLERRRKRESSVGLARSDLGHHQSNNASTRIIAMEQSIYPNHPTLFRLSISAPLSELCPIHSSRCATRTLPHTPFDVFFFYSLSCKDPALCATKSCLIEAVPLRLPRLCTYPRAPTCLTYIRSQYRTVLVVYSDSLTRSFIPSLNGVYSCLFLPARSPVVG